MEQLIFSAVSKVIPLINSKQTASLDFKNTEAKINQLLGILTLVENLNPANINPIKYIIISAISALEKHKKYLLFQNPSITSHSIAKHN